jgi:hypothetical protein
MSRAELAEKLGLSLGRVNQLLSIRGFGEYERVPIDLVYQVWNITKVPPTFLTERVIPPAHLRKQPPTTH